MTTDLEKQFFDTFGIEPILPCATCRYWYHDKDKCYWDYENDTECKAPKVYPQITDRILLELIRIIGLITIKYTNEQCEICYSDGAISYLGKDLKEAILNFLISKVSIFKHQVQALFEDER